MKVSLVEKSEEFLRYLDGWMDQLAPLSIDEALPNPDRAAVVCVDVTNGFCNEGPLSSPRVAAIAQPIQRLMEQAWAQGVRNIALTQDTHDPKAVEFNQWPPHCVRDTSEAHTVGEIAGLPFYNQMVTFEKNSIGSGLNQEFQGWLEEHPEIEDFVVVGDCTDLCTYQLAMHLRVEANERQVARRVIVPADCVQTYDRPVETAATQGGLPHPGDLMHATFLYHMQLNGVVIASRIE